MKGKTLFHFALLALVALVALYAFRVQKGSPASEDRFIGQPGPELQVEHWISEAPDTDGKFLLVDFWATWCGPCVRAIPHMNDLHAAFKDQLAIVGISREGQATVEQMKTPVMDYYSAIDTQGRMGSHFQVRSIPHIVLMAPDRTVLWKGHPARLSQAQLEAFLQEAQ